MHSIQGLSPRVLLMVLDGYGYNPETLHKNAISSANKPNLDEIFKHYPFTTIQPGGEAVGLPKGTAGNSEVGHLNLGAGRPVRQDLVRINECIAKAGLGDLPRFQELITKAKNGTKRIHLLGLLSDGGVHAHINHLKEILRLLREHSDLRIFLHAFMDGRDTAKDKGVMYVKDILQQPGFVFASMQGRSIGMDRDRRWEKIERSYKMMIGQSDKTQMKPEEYVLSEYKKGLYDEFISPVLFSEEGALREGDCIFFFNYRPDRAKQMTLALNDSKFKEFPVPVKPGYFLCMTAYVQEECPELPVLFDKEKIKGVLAEYLAKLGRNQFKIAETEKYAHVTYSFNGGEEQPFPGEERCLVQSPRDVATYDLKPEMSAREVTDKLIVALKDKKFSFYLVNYANADMVGHSGNFEATVKAIEALDECVGRVQKVCADENVTIILTADHGNADQMTYDDGGQHTSHSEAEVPFLVIHPKLYDQNIMVNQDNKVPALKDVAPTVLKILNINKPQEFSGQSVFV